MNACPNDRRVRCTTVMFAAGWRYCKTCRWAIEPGRCRGVKCPCCHQNTRGVAYTAWGRRHKREIMAA